MPIDEIFSDDEWDDDDEIIAEMNDDELNTSDRGLDALSALIAQLKFRFTDQF